jgi:hypothetical protein
MEAPSLLEARMNEKHHTDQRAIAKPYFQSRK